MACIVYIKSNILHEQFLYIIIYLETMGNCYVQYGSNVILGKLYLQRNYTSECCICVQGTDRRRRRLCNFHLANFLLFLFFFCWRRVNDEQKPTRKCNNTIVVAGVVSAANMILCLVQRDNIC